MFADAGIDLESAEKPTAVQTVWEIYQRFAAEPVDEAVDDPDADMLIFNHGVAQTDRGEHVFCLVLTRQFVLYDPDGEYDHMEQLHCDVWCDLTPEFERIGFEQGLFFPTASHLAEWVAEVERSPGFGVIALVPAYVGVRQEDI
jgi:hypothetical protein